MIYIPEGFAHGFQSLTDDVELLYFHTHDYVRQSEGGVRYNDTAIGIEWPIAVTVISERDQSHPLIDLHFWGITVS